MGPESRIWKRGSIRNERPRVLLIDEPELCLHPDAVREACRVLYDLAEKAGWQVMVTTHSPVFIDLSRDNTTVVRVERSITGDIFGTTLYRPEKAKLSEDDRENLKLLNIYDPYVAEFFFGGKVIIVEGDTEYAAFKFIMSQVAEGKISDVATDTFANVHIVRARGKATIVSLCKILNHFSTPYSVLHDSDVPTCVVKKGKNKGQVRTNPAWTINANILNIIKEHPFPDQIGVMASKNTFEVAFLSDACDEDKPYNAITELKSSPETLAVIYFLLKALVGPDKKLPDGALWSSELKAEDFVEAA